MSQVGYDRLQAFIVEMTRVVRFFMEEHELYVSKNNSSGKSPMAVFFVANNKMFGQSYRAVFVLDLQRQRFARHSGLFGSQEAREPELVCLSEFFWHDGG
jgi:hypothetical protein